jgi:hypothetical protein
MGSCHCRLLVVASAKDLKAFCDQEDWPAVFTEVELLEISPTRRSWQFTTAEPPLESLRLLAARWSLLTFLVDYDTGRTKGLVWLRGGAEKHHQVVYLGGGS